MDRVVEIVGLAARFLMASGVPPWAVMLACLAMAVVFILAPHALSSIWDAVKRIKPEPQLPPVSDGGTAGDRDLPPSARAEGEPGGGPTGGMG